MFSKLFKNYKTLPVQTNNIDTTQLDYSLELLRTTTAEVSEAAIKAAHVLQDRLRETEHRFFSIIDTIDDFVCIKDGDGRWLTLNKFGQDLYKWHNYEYIGKTDLELAVLYPEFKENLMNCYMTDESAWAKGNSIRIEEEFGEGDLAQIYDVVKTPVFDENGNRKEMIIVGRDITMVKQRHKRIKACFNALNSASDVITITDANGVIVFCNDKFLMKFGFTDHHEVVGQNMNIIASGKTPKSTYKELWKTIKSNKTWQHTITNKTVSGELVQCEVTVVPFMNGAPEPIYYICTMKPVKDK